MTCSPASIHSEFDRCLQELAPLSFDTWPPVKKQHYVSLALITSETMSQNDVFSRVTIHGSVDDIHRKKIPIEFESVFPTEIDSEKPYIVFIEGRPGAGKSTLITKASTDWANKEILQNVEIFILVRLRRLKDKLTLEDLFGIYCPQAINDRQRFISDVVKNILLTGGKGVCLAFDGLDEYRTLSESDNLIRKLIDGQILPNASIYMLSRPAGSHWLRSSKRLTHNIEIIGFSKKEIQNYIIDYYEAEPTKAQALLKYLQDHPNNIEQMCNIPLHLATIVSLYDLGPKLLPETETDLYDNLFFIPYTVPFNRRLKLMMVMILSFTPMHRYLPKRTMSSRAFAN